MDRSILSDISYFIYPNTTFIFLSPYIDVKPTRNLLIYSMYNELFFSFFHFQFIQYYDLPVALIGPDSILFSEMERRLQYRFLKVYRIPLYNNINAGSYYLHQVIGLYPNGAIILLNMTLIQLKSYSELTLNIDSYNKLYKSIALGINHQIISKGELVNLFFYDFIDYNSDNLDIFRDKLVALGDVKAEITSLMVITYRIVRKIFKIGESNQCS